MEISVIFPHTFEGSLGSTVRLRELLRNMDTNVFRITILSPYERTGFTWNGIRVVNTSFSAQYPQLGRIAYNISRKLYYNNLFMSTLYSKPLFRAFITRMITRDIMRNMPKMTLPDLVMAELDVSIEPALYLGGKLQVPVVVDLHNITPEELVAAGVVVEASKEFRDLQEQLKFLLNRVDGIIVVSDEMAKYVKENYGIPNSKIAIVPPGGGPKKMAESKQTKPSVVYSGMLTYRDHADLLIQSISHVTAHKSDTQFYLTRKGELLGSLTSLSRRLGVKPNFFWYPDERSFYAFLSSCHIGVLPSSDDQARRMGTPVKLFDYMSVGLPIVANYIGSWSEMIHKYKIGLLTEDCPKDFAQGILTLLEDVAFAEKCSKQALRLAHGPLSWRRSSRILEDFLRKIMQRV